VARPVVIIHNPVSDQSTADEKDVLIQVSAVREALAGLGHEVTVLPFDHRSRDFELTLAGLDPLCVFNLVESVDGDGRLIHWACSLLDHLGIAYTGASAEAMFLTSNKVLAKKWLHMAGIPTPGWLASGDGTPCACTFPGEYIVKALWEEASIGMDETSVVRTESEEELLRLVDDRSERLGCRCFAERYIEGREFNLSVLGGGRAPEVLPPAEIIFDFPPGRKRIVDWRAKWDEESFEYRATRRSFDFPAEDMPLLERLIDTALQCWRLFDLAGYARVDFRVDSEGRPWVLEINANPCISPDSGFVAACARAGIAFPEAVTRIVADALQRR
jgi:D-alanine-D-alanine ligase